MVKISTIRGDSLTINVPVTDSSGNAVNLTGGELFLTVNASKEPTDDSQAVISKSTTSFTSPATGIGTFTLSNTDTQNITPGTYFYDVQFKDATGSISSTKRDTFIVTGDISRRII